MNVADSIDFRVGYRYAIGHDALNTIIFKHVSHKRLRGYPWFDGGSWKAIMFVYSDKAVLLRELRELGAQAAETNLMMRSMPDKLSLVREEADRAVKQLQPPVEASRWHVND